MGQNLPRPGTPSSEARPSRPSTEPNFPAGRSVIVILVVTALFVLTQLYAAIPLSTPVSSALGGDATFALSTSFSLTYAAGFLIWGPVSDRYGRKRVMAIAVGVLAVTTLLCALASSPSAMTLLRALQGLSASGFAPVALAYLAEAVAPARRAGAIGAMSTSFLVAGIFGQVLASVIALRAGWPWFFVLCGIVLAIAFALILAAATEAPRHAPSPSLLAQFANLARLLTMPVIVLLSIAHITLLLSFVALYTGIGQHLQSLDMPASATVLIRLAALPAMFISLSVGALAQRLAMARVAQLGFTLAAVALSGTIPGLVAASIVYVAGVALAVPSMINLYGEAAAPNRGSGMAINGFVLFIGAGIGSVVGTTFASLSTLAIVLVALLAVAAASVGAVSALTRRAAHD